MELSLITILNRLKEKLTFETKMEERNEYLVELISLARSDLEDAIILYENDSFRNAICPMQQSVEPSIRLLFSNKNIAFSFL